VYKIYYRNILESDQLEDQIQGGRVI